MKKTLDASPRLIQRFGMRGAVLTMAFYGGAVAGDILPPSSALADPPPSQPRVATPKPVYGLPPRPNPKPKPKPIDHSAQQLDGEWVGSGNDGQSLSWRLTYSISAGRYTLEGYPPLSESGSIALERPPEAEADGSVVLVVQRTQRTMNGEPASDSTDRWVLSPDGESFTLSNGMHFKKQTPPPPPSK